MPTTYTHYAFGQEVKQLLPKKLEYMIDLYEDYYNIGVHGPDILFYYRSFYKNKVNQYGVKVHNEPMKVFLDHAYPVFEQQHRKRAAFAYLAGFMTHFILDSTCHPYINRRIVETGISHAEIERDWDTVMMQRDHLNPARHQAASHIHVNPAVSILIAPYYDLTPRQMQNALLDMKLVLNHFFRSPFGLTGRLARMTNSVILRRYNYGHYFARKDINPGNLDSINQLDRLFKDCRGESAEKICELYQALKAGDRSFSDLPRFQRIFS